MEKYKISSHNPIGRERSFDPNKPIRVEINGVLYKIRIDKKENALFISKVGLGSLRGKVDRITIIPETAHEFLIK
jgi:hypothetical protein